MRKWEKLLTKQHLSNYATSDEQDTLEEDMGDWHNRVKHLEEAHRALALQLHDMEQHPHVDEAKVAELKKKKLQLKDDIQRLKTEHGE